MSRTWAGIGISVCVALALFAGAVLYAVHRPPKARGFSGLEFAALTPAASARMPLLPRGGALIFQVAADSPAEKAKIKPGEVVAAIDGKPVQSARQVSDLVRRYAAGDHAVLTLYDIPKGDPRPQQVSLTFDAAPPIGKKFSVHPPRTLAKEYFLPPMPAANASWSRRILRGPTIRPLALSGLGAGACNGFAPEEWRIAGYAPDNSLFHLMAKEGFQHAIYKEAALNGTSAQDFVQDFLRTTFDAPALLTPPQSRPFGFVVRDFGNQKGGAGFVLYRVTGNRIALWVAAVAGGEVAWAKPLVGAVALSLRCASPGAPAPKPRDASLLATRISTRCIQGACSETDFAATYLTVLQLGYVHNEKGEMFLVHPHTDFWQDGPQGSGFYHQIGGENEKLDPGKDQLTLPDMKTIGVLGGMSNQATAEYYRLINESVNSKLGGWNTAEVVVSSVNFANIERFVRTGAWEDAGRYLAEKAQGLERAGADLLICVSNTMHRVSDIFTAELTIPFLHIADPTGEAIRAAGLTRVGLLGTKPVMSAPYLRDYYRRNFNIEILVPDEEEQILVDRIIFDELVRRDLRAGSRTAYLDVIDRLRSRGAQGVILGCTEIFLLVSQADRPDFPIFDTTALHAARAVNLALGTT